MQLPRYEVSPEFKMELRDSCRKAGRLTNSVQRLDSGQEVRIPAAQCRLAGFRPDDVLIFGKFVLEATRPGDTILCTEGSQARVRRMVRIVHDAGRAQARVTKPQGIEGGTVEIHQIMGTMVAVGRESRRIGARHCRREMRARIYRH